MSYKITCSFIFFVCSIGALQVQTEEAYYSDAYLKIDSILNRIRSFGKGAE
jgi:hypothetical protein